VIAQAKRRQTCELAVELASPTASITVKELQH
jgi:hypothetical protein